MVAGSAETLAKNMEMLYAMQPEDRDLLGQSGRAYFLEHFEMEWQTRRLIEILNSRMGK